MRLIIDEKTTIDTPTVADVDAAVTRFPNQVCLESSDGFDRVYCCTTDTGALFLEHTNSLLMFSRITSVLPREEFLRVLQQILAKDTAWTRHAAWQKRIPITHGEGHGDGIQDFILLASIAIIAVALWCGHMPKLLYFNPVCQAYAQDQGWTDGASYGPAGGGRGVKSYPATCGGEYPRKVLFDTAADSVQPVWPARLLFELHLFEVVSIVMSIVVFFWWAGRSAPRKRPRHPPGAPVR